jgi:hypothetical protein
MAGLVVLVFLPKEVAKYCLLDDASIFTAELPFIKDFFVIQESTLHDLVIYSDSLSSLESIEQLYPTRHPLHKSNPRRNSQSGSRQKHRIRLGTRT